MMPELTERELQLVTTAATKTVEEFAKTHHCRFSSRAASNVHALDAAMKEAKADHGTLRLLVLTGKDWQDMTRSARRKILVLISVTVILITGNLWVPLLFKWLTRR